MAHVCFDFDGVIHSYTTPWVHDTIIPDPPTPGIREVIRKLRDHGYQVVILTSRCLTPGGKEAIEEWLNEYDIAVDDITSEKIPARCYVDDRAVCFTGDTSSLFDTIDNYEPWWKAKNPGGDLPLEPAPRPKPDATALYGAIIGDVAGSRFEYNNIKSKNFSLFGDGCHITDDTVMTAAVADAFSRIHQNPGGDARAAMAASLMKWGSAYPDADYGRHFREWLEDRDPTAVLDSYGNGAPMRCSAAGWAAASPEEARALGELSCWPTHTHPASLKAAALVAELIYLARTGSTREYLRRIADRHYAIPKLDDIRADYVYDVTSGGTMPPALAAFFESTDFEDAIRNAISVGGDSDTLAAITGSIAEAFYGVPRELREGVRPYLLNQPLLLDVIVRFNHTFVK